MVGVRINLRLGLRLELKWQGSGLGKVELLMLFISSSFSIENDL